MVTTRFIPSPGASPGPAGVEGATLPGMPIVCLAAVVLSLLAPPPAIGVAPLGPPHSPSVAAGLIGIDASTPMPISPRWRAPLPGPLIVRRGFHPPSTPWTRGHRGVDLAASTGSRILAAGSGRVVFAGLLAGRGVISIEHAPGVRTTYEPVRAVVRVGNVVRAGDVIGRLTSDVRHRDRLHWGLRIRNGYADPMRLLRGRPILKPRSAVVDPGHARGWA